MKTVMKNNAETAHYWANGLTESGTNPIRSLYFHTDNRGRHKHRIIFSYGSHFPIANIVNDSVAFVTTRSYSPTTTSHQSLVDSSIPHNIPVVYCYDPNNLMSDSNFEKPIAELSSLMDKLNNARKPEIYLLQIRNLSLRFSNFVEQLKKLNYNVKPKLQETLSAPLLTLHTDVENQLAKFEKQVEQIKKANEKRRLVEIEKNTQKFRAGELNKFYSPFQVLRLHGDYIRTSLMIDIPIRSSEEIIRFFVNNINNEALLSKLIGKHIENFTINAVDFTEKYVTIGCHKIKFEEIINIEQQIFRQAI